LGCLGWLFNGLADQGSGSHFPNYRRITLLGLMRKADARVLRRLRQFVESERSRLNYVRRGTVNITSENTKRLEINAAL